MSLDPQSFEIDESLDEGNWYFAEKHLLTLEGCIGGWTLVTVIGPIKTAELCCVLFKKLKAKETLI